VCIHCPNFFNFFKTPYIPTFSRSFIISFFQISWAHLFWFHFSRLLKVAPFLSIYLFQNT
jgi:hypothetical protein